MAIGPSYGIILLGATRLEEEEDLERDLVAFFQAEEEVMARAEFCQVSVAKASNGFELGLVWAGDGAEKGSNWLAMVVGCCCLLLFVWGVGFGERLSSSKFWILGIQQSLRRNPLLNLCHSFGLTY